MRCGAVRVVVGIVGIDRHRSGSAMRIASVDSCSAARRVRRPDATRAPRARARRWTDGCGTKNVNHLEEDATNRGDERVRSDAFDGPFRRVRRFFYRLCIVDSFAKMLRRPGFPPFRRRSIQDWRVFTRHRRSFSPFLQVARRRASSRRRHPSIHRMVDQTSNSNQKKRVFKVQRARSVIF